jgi:sialate O-acetylesterase
LALALWFVLLFLGFIGPSRIGLAGSLELPSIFSENMILQRGTAVPVWGRAGPGREVTVTVYEGGKQLSSKKTTGETKSGDWRVELDLLPTGGRYSLLIESRNQNGRVADRLLFTNVMVGEVWITCGQSNMIWPIDSSVARDEAVRNRHEYPNIRAAQMGMRNVHEVTDKKWDTRGFWGPVRWEETSYLLPRSSKTDVPGSTSAVGYYFARELYDYFGGKVPVGLINIGAILRAESWVDEPTVQTTPGIAHLAGKIYPHATSRAFKGNIAPLAPYAVRGAIYYQGEMNAGAPQQYRFALEALIKSWRRAWNDPELPFLIVQLPGFIQHKKDGEHRLDMDAESLEAVAGQNVDHNFCYIREAQLQVYRSMPRVGMAITIDLGTPWNIHPPRKKPVGKRLALQARKMVYGDQNLVAQGPVPRRFEKGEEAFVVGFSHVGSGLFAKGGNQLKGFELRTADGHFVDARARIEDARVIVSAEGISDPTGVRYAWAGYPDGNLYNREGLPAPPFIHPEVDFEDWKGKLSERE